EAVLLHEPLVARRPIRRVGPHRARHVAFVEQLWKRPAVMGGGTRHRVTADEAEALVGPDMVLVAEGGHYQFGHLGAVRARLHFAPAFQCPARVAILLGQLGRIGLPVLGDLALFQRGFPNAAKLTWLAPVLAGAQRPSLGTKEN